MTASDDSHAFRGRSDGGPVPPAVAWDAGPTGSQQAAHHPIALQRGLRPCSGGGGIRTSVDREAHNGFRDRAASAGAVLADPALKTRVLVAADAEANCWSISAGAARAGHSTPSRSSHSMQALAWRSCYRRARPPAPSAGGRSPSSRGARRAGSVSRGDASPEAAIGWRPTNRAGVGGSRGARSRRAAGQQGGAEE